jgi:hypothetical protein
VQGGRFVRQRIPLVVATALALLVPAAAASANARQLTTVEAPAELLGSAPEAALDQVQSLGATAIRLQIVWSSVAPSPTATHAPSFNATDPSAYPAAGWARYDRAIDGARARGLGVLLTITGGAPRWATASKRDMLTNPSASAFGKFAMAVGRRYRAKVSWWSIWNEPNLGKLLKPLYKGRGNGTLASAGIYRRLYLSAYSGLRAAGVRAPILIGELAPRSNRLHANGTIAPLRFLRGVLCLDAHYRKARRCGRVPTQGVAIHPYSTAAGPRLVPPNTDEVTIGVLSRLTSALDRAAHAGALPSHLPVYVTEFGVQSFPDHDAGVSLAAQSDFRSLGEYMAYRNPRVASFSQYLLRDDATVDGATGRFESGLFLFKGYVPKPSLISFRIPLVVVAHRGSSRIGLWGLVRPAHGHPGSVRIEYADRGHGWHALATQRYGASGYWTRRATTRSGRAWRVDWTAPDGTMYTGPATIAR